MAPTAGRAALRPLCLSSINTERAKLLSGLCVEAVRAKDETEAMPTREEIRVAQ